MSDPPPPSPPPSTPPPVSCRHISFSYVFFLPLPTLPSFPQALHATHELPDISLFPLPLAFSSYFFSQFFLFSFPSPPYSSFYPKPLFVPYEVAADTPLFLLSHCPSLPSFPRLLLTTPEPPNTYLPLSTLRSLPQFLSATHKPPTHLLSLLRALLFLFFLVFLSPF